MSKLSPLSLAFVCPRYKPPAAGGAEAHIGCLAQHFADLGHKVEMLTTCTHDHITWKNHLPEGKTKDGKILVRRFPIKEDRNLEVWIPLQQKLEREETLTLEEEKKWMQENVHAPNMYKYIENNSDEYDVILLAPYLFGVPHQAAKVCPEKSVWIPCLHDEPAAKCEIFKQALLGARGVFFNTHPEMELAKRLYQIKEDKCTTVAMGIEESITSYDADRFRKKYSLEDPFILYAGRREDGKNVPLLIDYFTGYVRNNDTNLRLVFLGSGDLHIKPEVENKVIDLGYISEEDKADAYAAASIFCMPSTNESFSIVLLEAWLASTAALVHADCAVTKNHVVASRGGLYFKDFYQFAECVDLMLNNREFNKALGQNGREYVKKNYSWKEVERKFFEGLVQLGIIESY